MAVTAGTPLELIDGVYATLAERVATGRRRAGRPLTFAEKVLVNHMRDPEGGGMERARSYTDFGPDRVARQDAPPPPSPTTSPSTPGRAPGGAAGGGPGATPTSGPAGWGCRAPPPRWRCSS